MITPKQPGNHSPLNDLGEWEEDLLRRYPEPKKTQERSAFTDPEKEEKAFRNYDAEARDSVREFYRLNHRYQTVEFVIAKAVANSSVCSEVRKASGPGWNT